MRHTIAFFFFVALTIIPAQSQVRGIWYWTWSSSANMGNKNLGVAFSGWVDPDQAIAASQPIIGKLLGSKYISLGGGNANGHWTGAVLQKIASACNAGKFKGYTGIAFDIEEGDSGLSGAFRTAFTACKSKGLKILITVSHSAPYGISDASALMQSFFSNKNIDYFSPQLYTSGSEGANDYSTAGGVPWSQYKSVSGRVIPSIVGGTYYADAQKYFAKLGITTVGYVQWSQTLPSSAVAGSGNVFQESTPANVLTPLQIGLIAGGCTLFVVGVVVVIIVIVKARKLEEKV